MRGVFLAASEVCSQMSILILSLCRTEDFTYPPRIYIETFLFMNYLVKYIKPRTTKTTRKDNWSWNVTLSSANMLSPAFADSETRSDHTARSRHILFQIYLYKYITLLIKVYTKTSKLYLESSHRELYSYIYYYSLYLSFEISKKAA